MKVEEIGGVKVHLENNGQIKASVFENYEYAEQAHTNLNNAGLPCRLFKSQSGDYVVFYDFEV